MKKIFLLILLAFCPLSFVFADTKNSVNIYFFHSNTCSHCKAENNFLKSIEKQYDNVNVYRYEVHDEKNTDKIRILPIFTLDNSMNASILGVLSGINIIFLCSLVLFFFLIQKEKEHKNRLFLFLFYFFFSYLGNIYLIKQGIWYFLFIILFFFVLIFYSLKKKKSVFCLADIGLVLSLMVTLITKYYFSYTIDIFNHINNYL